ncbi:ABC transporter permease/M1 family aminopeptidase [Hymenobacter convexus]|uniref:ABC transporter permease/M1 family aminopeptidase n=1 Tax=Hymenobacter sp. CA1UV-4 TaxID=3063782 RepID=UPI002713DA98|nr:M1 family aminopeptidase [Hymenobacter sp. CA1UV-4]MDO7852152.1 M1 family aminopeptidase [Hymenobacter sp. CA1UV-4]
MFLHILRFELRYRFTQPSTYLYFGVFALAGFLSQTVEDFGFASAKVHVNSPDALAQLHIIASILGMFVTAAILGTPIYRDDKDGITGLVYTTSITKPAYLSGRFLGSLLAIWFIMSGISVGALLGMLMPWVESDKLGPVMPLALLGPLVFGAWVNALFAGCIFFAAYLLFRSPLVVYLGGIVLFVLYQVSFTFANKVSSDHLFAQLDPFGLGAKNIDANYWTIAERNTRLLNFFGGELVQNRLLWGSIGVVLLLVACALFRLGQPKTRVKKAAPEAAPVMAVAGGLRRSPQAFGAGLGWWQLRQMVKVQALNVVRAWPFRVLALLGVVFVLFNAYFTYEDARGIQMPVTYLILRLVNDNYTLFQILIITIYAGELVWRERDTRLQLVFDALPFSNWVPFLSKLLALLAVQVLLTLVMDGVGLAIQLYRAPALVEPLLYFKDFTPQVANVAVLCTLALAVQTVANNKYVGHALMMVYYGVVFLLADALGLHHALLKFGAAVPYTYSDMNGYGHMVAPLLAINTYYLAGALVLVLLTGLLWVRGNDAGAGARMRLFGQRLRGAGMRPALAAGLGLFFVAGGWVFYNANILNQYVTPKALEARQAAAERAYKRYENLPQPKIVAIRLNADLYPTASPRGYRMAGTYTLRNKESRALDTLFINYDANPSLTNRLSLSRAAQVLHNDPVAGVRLYRLARPLAPGDSLDLRFDVAYRARGFTSRLKANGVFDWATISPEDRLTANGTFLNDPGLHIGYQPGSELEDDNVRQRNGLRPKDRARRLNDPRGRNQADFGPDGDYVRYQATVSTDPDQVAITPGYLQKEWLQYGRRYFRYQMDQPMMPMVSVLSARYQMHRESWQNPAGGPPVAIEIYHDPKHGYNVARMAEALRKALPYYTAAFGPYQYRQIRVLEFPRYKSFAQSFPNTVPFSESAGFIDDLRDSTKPDLTFFITNHELAHQWWGHQLVGANVQGSSMLVESLAEYSAIMTAKHEFTPNKMQQFMRRELDNYLRGRRQERKKEQPLMLCESQPYIHYYKGGMVFYALQDYIGEDKLNGALRAFITKNRYQTRPYPNTADLMAYLRQATPDSMQYVLHDMFETITLYKNELKSATYTPRPDGKYNVSLTIKAEKLRADSLGNEKSIPVADYVDLGIFGPDKSQGEAWDVRGKALFLKKIKLTKPETTLSFVVNEKPVKAGVDPYQKLIERYYIDNVKYVDEQKAGSKPVAVK